MFRSAVIFFITFVLTAYFLSLNSSAGQTGKPLKIVNITPSGEDVTTDRQITFQFNRPVVPVGRMDRDASEIPIVITPEVKGQWRWLNTSTLALMLDDDNTLSSATRYDVKVKTGIRAKDGATLEKPVLHTFITERPKVVKTEFDIWESPVMPVIGVIFNQPVSKKSVEEHLAIRIKDQQQNRIAVSAKPDPDFEESSNKSHYFRERYGLRKYRENISLTEKNEYKEVWLIFPKDNLPKDAEIEYIIEPGLESSDGPEKGIENRLISTLHTFPAFSFLGIRCTKKKNYEDIFIKPGEPKNNTDYCDPTLQISLIFSTPVFDKDIKTNITLEPDHPQLTVDDYLDNIINYSKFEYSHEKDKKYYFDISNLFIGDKVYRLTGNQNLLHDIFGRVLSNPIDIQFTTDHLPKRYYLMDSPLVLEKNADTVIPFDVSNIEVIKVKYDRLTSKGRDSSIISHLPFIKSKDSILKTKFPVRKMLGGCSGIIEGEIVSPNIYEKYDSQYPDSFSAQVTPFHVHVKISEFNTIVWVTDMSTGKPVSGAKVKIYKDENNGLSEKPEILDEGITDSDGLVLLAGKGKLTPEWSSLNPDSDYIPMYIRVEKEEDFALLTLNNHYGSPYSVSSGRRFFYYNANKIHAWGTTAQGVYRVGDRIQYKIYVRDQNMQSFIAAPKKGYTLEVIDPQDKKVFEAKDLVLSEFGALHGEFDIPKTAITGWYSFELSSPYYKGNLHPMKVLVSDFTASPFTVTTEVNNKNYLPGDELKVNTHARFHSGAPYGNAFNRVTASLEGRSFYNYFKSNKGIVRSFIFDDPYQSDEITFKAEGVLDKNGDLTSGLTVPDSDTLFGILEIESAVRDDRGKYVTERTTAKYASRDRLVGLRYADGHYTKAEVLNNAPCSMEILVVDMYGEPITGVPVDIKLEYEEIKTLPVQGGIKDFKNRYKKELVLLDNRVLKSEEQPLNYSFTPEKANRKYTITASIHDSRGREHSTQAHTYARTVVIDRDPKDKNEDREIEITPDKKEYKVGEIARYIVKNPIPGANALITIERSGIMKSWVQKLDTDTSLIKVKVKEEYFPGYFLSVVIASPRPAIYPIGKQEEPGKPDFKMGYIFSTVDDSSKRLSVKVNPEKVSYKPGETVKVDFNAGSQYKPVELAVAVLNEEVLSLLFERTDYFDPYKGIFTVDGLGVENLNLLKHLSGYMNFDDNSDLSFREGYRSLPMMVAKMGGVSDSLFVTAFDLKEVDKILGNSEKDTGLRSNFKTVSYWNQSIITDDKGKASIKFEAPDNLTGWRILAMAATPTDQMGLGEGYFSVTKDTEIRPVMPNQVIEGDSFEAGFSIMNKADKPRELTITIIAEGAIKTNPDEHIRKITQTVSAVPYKRTTVWLPLKTKGSGKIKFTAKGGDAGDQDGLVYDLEVHKIINIETAATYGTTTEGAVIEQLQFPDEIRTDVGEVKVSLSPSVIGNIEGAFKYLRDYPYECWEQRLTKGTIAAHYQNLKKYIPEEFIWDTSEELTRNILKEASSYQAPNGGMAFYIPEDCYVSPYLSAYTAISFNWLKENGYNVPYEVQEKLNDYLLSMIKKSEYPDFYSKGMTSTVQAVALYALAKQHRINYGELERFYPHVKEMDLFGKAYFLMAALETYGAEEMCKGVFDMILSHAHQAGGKFIFTETLDTGYSRILSSSLRSNAAILSSLIAYGKTEEGKKLVGDIPFKLVRYITQTRKQSGRWENTQENIFCMNALVEYSKTYENVKPDMKIVTLIDNKIIGDAIFNGVRDDAVVQTKPIERKDPGHKSEVIIERKGKGRLYYSVGMNYAPLKPNTEPINAGIDIKREYSVERNGEWILLKSPMEIKRGELVRVDLFVSLPAARNFVVVDDPVPGGLEPVNSDLATSSQVDADKGAYKPAGGSWWFHYGDWSYYGMSRWSFYHRELRHSAARFYSEYLSAGNYHLSYTAQAIASGEFTVMPTHAEEMYDPDVFGKSSAAVLNVKIED